MAGVASQAFAVTTDGTLSGTVDVVGHDGGVNGVFAPGTLILNSSTTSGSITWTPPAGFSGAATITLTNTGSLTNPAAKTYTVTAAAPAAATALSLSGPTSGTAGNKSSAFTITANGALSGNVSAVPTDFGAGGLFTNATVGLTPSSTSGTFTYTPASGVSGNINIGLTNNGGLTNPANHVYAVAAANNLAAGTAYAVTLGATGTLVATPAVPSGFANVGTSPMVIAIDFIPTQADISSNAALFAIWGPNSSTNEQTVIVGTGNGTSNTALEPEQHRQLRLHLRQQPRMDSRQALYA